MKVSKFVSCLVLVACVGVGNARGASDPFAAQPSATFNSTKTVQTVMSCVQVEMLRKGWQTSVAPLDGNREAIVLAGPFGSTAAIVEAQPTSTGSTISLIRKRNISTYVGIINGCI